MANREKPNLVDQPPVETKRGLGAQTRCKRVFTIILYNMEDKNKIFEWGPYFYNSAGLYLTFWQERFNLDKVNLSIAPIWLRLYSLP